MRTRRRFCKSGKRARKKSRKKRGGRNTRKKKYFQRKGGVMRRRRKHFMVGGGYYNTGGVGAQSVLALRSGSDFSKGFIAGYQSCNPPSHFMGYSPPI